MPHPSSRCTLTPLGRCQTHGLLLSGLKVVYNKHSSQHTGKGSSIEGTGGWKKLFRTQQQPQMLPTTHFQIGSHTCSLWPASSSSSKSCRAGSRDGRHRWDKLNGCCSLDLEDARGFVPGRVLVRTVNPLRGQGLVGSFRVSSEETGVPWSVPLGYQAFSAAHLRHHKHSHHGLRTNRATDQGLKPLKLGTEIDLFSCEAGWPRYLLLPWWERSKEHTRSEEGPLGIIS